jgi:ankyrin repeat protein
MLRSSLQTLWHDSNVLAESKDRYGWTPLWWAAENGHEAVVKVLQLFNTA